ncbi:unnamed protein product [Orchesella dallaii]|uniref:Uncharacterized protein n=1 Tax=Orchesella dallaii TaxID=48710 RepID=A0ABP1PVY8_9HEXA
MTSSSIEFDGMSRWANRKALVTGCSSGIGAVIAKDLVRYGVVVIGCARNVEKIDMSYLFALVIMCSLFLLGAVKFMRTNCDPEWNFVQIVSCEPWITFMSLQAAAHGSWVLVLLICQLYQILWLGLTTNERLNWTRYTYFKRFGAGNGCCRMRSSTHSNPGVVKNFIDFFELECFSPDKTDWVRVFNQPQDQEESSVDSQPLIRDKRDSFQYV